MSMRRLLGKLGYTLPLAALVLATCGVAAPPRPTPDPFAGQYSATGGGGALPAVQALADRFKILHPGVTFTVSETGSDAAINLAATGDVDVGFISRSLTDKEVAKVGALPIGFSGTAIIVNAANPVTNLTKDQVRRIYAGEVASWVELGGDDLPVKPFIREANAATRTTFEAFVFGGKPPYAKTVIEINETTQMLTAVASFRGGIGVATIGSRTAADTRLRMISIDGAAPTLANITGGSYKIFRQLFLVYPVDPTRVKPAVRAFLDYARSQEGQQVAASVN